MEIAAVVERVEYISTARANPAADAALIKSGLVAIREVRAWCDAQQAGLVRSPRFIDSFPENTVAEAAEQSLGKAAKTTERSDTLNTTPKLADALDDGAITAEHVDAVTRASWNLLPVCSIHHTNIHHDGWIIELGPNRELTLRLPDGTIHTTGPPNQRTAA